MEAADNKPCAKPVGIAQGNTLSETSLMGECYMKTFKKYRPCFYAKRPSMQPSSNGDYYKVSDVEEALRSASDNTTEDILKSTHNTSSPKCLCLSCSRLLANGGTCEPNTNSFVTACGGYRGTSGN